MFERKEKIVKSLFLVELIIASVAVCMIIASLLLPALNVGEQTSSAEFEYKTYSGFEVSVFCWPAFILNNQYIKPNPVLIAAILLPIISIIVRIAVRKASIKICSVVDIVLAFSLIFFAVSRFLLTDLVMIGATEKFEEIVFYAKEKGMFGLHAYTIITALVSLTSAAISIISASYEIIYSVENKLYLKKN